MVGVLELGYLYSHLIRKDFLYSHGFPVLSINIVHKWILAEVRIHADGFVFETGDHEQSADNILKRNSYVRRSGSAKLIIDKEEDCHTQVHSILGKKDLVRVQIYATPDCIVKIV
ncbi:hypothetical protein MMC11_007341 [Xylographa trunciseda]|nr:hypothetical protein [Xylographa trunciseda]